ncbi:MAG: hypothetical protein HZC54_11765 [Verrucomicrobia bacterium]|nr:hypothetical protein [Verrucomicrobiota bacterium]
MRHQRYYPAPVGDQIVWLTNFMTKLPGHETALGLTGAYVDACVASCAFLIYVLKDWLPAVRTFNLAATSATETLAHGEGPSALTLPAFAAPALPDGVVAVPPGVLTPRLFDLVAQIKKMPGYTETIGLDLGIIGQEAGVGGDGGAGAPYVPVPKFKVTVKSTVAGPQVVLEFIKHGHTGVYIESRVGNGPWEFLGTDTNSPYTDARPLQVAGQPEVRQYRMCFWDKSEPTNDWSDIASVTVGP